MTLPPLLRPSYWFGLNPPPFLPMVDKVLFVLFVALFVGGVIARMIAMRAGWEKLTKRVIVRSANALLSLGVVGLVLYGISSERVPALSMRFGYLLWVVLAVILGWRLYKLVWKEIPEIRTRAEEREQFNKWLPKPKA